MADVAEQIETDEPPKKKGKGLLFGIIGAVLAGGGAGFAVYSGIVPLGGGGAEQAESAEMEPELPAQPMTSFIELEPIVISLGAKASAKHLQMSAQLEAATVHEEEVRRNMPRIIDVLGTYLRAVDESDLSQPSAMARLRAQMLRRVQVISGPGRIRDLLVTEFILN